MGSCTGEILKLTVFGESHGPEVGAVLDGFPSGIFVDKKFIADEMRRRSADGNRLATPRKEKDLVRIVSGVFEERTTGTPICGVIENTTTHSKDYLNLVSHPRPGHADYTASLRYKGFQDYRGGGHFSGRLTAPIVFAGALCKLALRSLFPEMHIGARITSLGGVRDESVVEDYADIRFDDPRFPVLDPSSREAMKARVVEAMKESDSVGGTIEGFVTGYPAGLGDPIFGSVESRLSSLLFSIPAVKGVSFGAGFSIADMTGSEANDLFYEEDGRIRTRTNHNGGINGGITNGMPIVFDLAIKPTASIARAQETLNLSSGQVETLKIEGRHDPAILTRACPVVEAVTAFGLLDLYLSSQK